MVDRLICCSFTEVVSKCPFTALYRSTFWVKEPCYNLHWLFIVMSRNSDWCFISSRTIVENNCEMRQHIFSISPPFHCCAVKQHWAHVLKACKHHTQSWEEGYVFLGYYTHSVNTIYTSDTRKGGSFCLACNTFKFAVIKSTWGSATCDMLDFLLYDCCSPATK